MKKSELDLARQVIESLAGDFEPTELASEYRRDLRALLEAKMRGEEIVAPGAGRGRAGHRPHGGAQGERRRGEEAGRACGEARARAQGSQQGELETRRTRERDLAGRALEHERGDSAGTAPHLDR